MNRVTVLHYFFVFLLLGRIVRMKFFLAIRFEKEGESSESDF